MTTTKSTNSKSANTNSAKSTGTKSEPIDYKSLEKLLQLHAKGLGIPSGSADAFIKETINSTQNYFKNKSIITDGDLKRKVTKELRKYSADFAYVYENCDIII